MQPLPDFGIDFVPSVAIIIVDLVWIMVVRLSGYSVKTCHNSCCFQRCSLVQCSDYFFGLWVLDNSSFDFNVMTKLPFMIDKGKASLGDWWY